MPSDLSVDTIRSHSFALLSKAYTNISVDTAATMLGLSPAETVEKTTHAGWTYNADTKLLIPKVVPEAKIQTTSALRNAITHTYILQAWSSCASSLTTLSTWISNERCVFTLRLLPTIGREEQARRISNNDCRPSAMMSGAL